MKPVIIQHLLRHRKKNTDAVLPMTEKEKEQYDKAMSRLVFWFVIFLVIAGLLIA